MFGRIDIHKEQNITSFGVVARIRRILNTRRCGHNGTLDPMATGVLSVYVGKATTFVDRLRTPIKEYIGTVRFGYESDTLDVWGKVQPVTGNKPTYGDILSLLPNFTGDIVQIPPMISAVKVKGKRLYKYAREGKEVERLPRLVHVEEFRCLSFCGEEARFIVRCSKGTYIRTLFSDLALQLGTKGVMTQLERTENDSIRLENCFTLDDIFAMNERRDFRFLREPAELQPFSKWEVNSELLEEWRRGKKTPFSANLQEQESIVLTHRGHFIGTAVKKGDHYFPEKVIL